MNKRDQVRLDRLENDVDSLSDDVRKLTHYTTFRQGRVYNISMRTVIIAILEYLHLTVEEVEATAPSIKLVPTKGANKK